MSINRSDSFTKNLDTSNSSYEKELPKVYAYNVDFGKIHLTDENSSHFKMTFYGYDLREEKVRDIFIRSIVFSDWFHNSFGNNISSFYGMERLYDKVVDHLSYYTDFCKEGVYFITESYLNEFIEKYNRDKESGYDEFFEPTDPYFNFETDCTSEIIMKIRKRCIRPNRVSRLTLMYYAIATAGSWNPDTLNYSKILKLDINWDKVRECLIENNFLYREDEKVRNVYIGDIWKKRDNVHIIAFLGETDSIDNDISYLNNDYIKKFRIPNKEIKLEELLDMYNYILDLMSDSKNLLYFLIGTTVEKISFIQPLRQYIPRSIYNIFSSSIITRSSCYKICDPKIIRDNSESEFKEIMRLLRITQNMTFNHHRDLTLINEKIKVFELLK